MRDKRCGRRAGGGRSGDERRTDEHARRAMAGVSITIALAIFAWTVGPVLPAGADLSSLSPAGGVVVEPGESTTFSLLSGEHCVRASSDDATISVSVDDKGDCGSDAERSIVVSVTTASDTPAGPHTVTVSEIGVQGGQGQSIVWSFTVTEVESSATTSTSGSTTTTVPPTTDTTVPDLSTTVDPSSTSSTTPATTGSTAEPGESPATSVAPADDGITSTTLETGPSTSNTAEEPAASDGDDETAPEVDGADADSNEGEVSGAAEDVQDGGDVEVLGLRISPGSEGEPEFSGLAAGEFSRALTGLTRPVFDGLRLSEFLDPFGDGEDETPRSHPAPLVPWATRVMVVFTLAEFVRGRDKMLQAG